MFLRRREFLSGVVGAGCGLAASSSSRYQIGISPQVSGTPWAKDIWLAFRQIREVGYHYVEAFIGCFLEYYNAGKPEELKKKMVDVGVRFVTISNSRPMESHYED